MTRQNYVWKNGIFIEKEKAVVNVFTHALHYGSAGFEGIRAYKTKNGPAILELKKHIERFQYTIKTLGMNIKYSFDNIFQAVIDSVNKNQYESCYIRTLAYYANSGSLKVTPRADHPIGLIIICMPMGRYLDADKVDVMISKYIRIHPKSTVCDAKISGHYVNSILANIECRNTKYHEALMLDFNNKVAEGAAQNIFIVKNKTIYTTPLGTILPGITRSLVIKFCKKAGFKVIETYFEEKDLIEADEIFFTGTAAEITPVRSINNKIIGNTENDGEITKYVKKHYYDISHGIIESNVLTYC